jgi:hypothetical protein
MLVIYGHTLNMEVNLQSLFGLHGIWALCNPLYTVNHHPLDNWLNYTLFKSEREQRLLIRIRRVRMFYGLPDPDLSLFVRIRIRILPSTIKKVRKSLISTIFYFIF